MATRRFSFLAQLLAVLILLAGLVLPAGIASAGGTSSGDDLGSRLSISPQGEILLDGGILIPASRGAFPIQVFTWPESSAFTIKFATCQGVDRWTFFAVYEITPEGELVNWSTGGWDRTGRCTVPGTMQV